MMHQVATPKRSEINGLPVKNHLQPATLFSLICLVLLAGCQTVPAAPERQVVQVQVPVPCVDAATKPAPAVSTKAQLVGLPDDTLVLTLAQERLELAAWAAEVSPVLDACRVVPVP